MDDIHNKVFEYVKVLARPMVLYQHDHPIHWSPAYVGGKVRNLICVIHTNYLLLNYFTCKLYYSASIYYLKERGKKKKFSIVHILC
jgi:hypothetical protein